MTDPHWYSLLPPIFAIALAILTRQVLISLVLGTWLGYSLAALNPLAGLAGAIDGIINVFSDAGNTRVILFTLLVGGLIATMEKTGGVKGFVSWLERRQLANNPARAQLLAWLAGVAIFIESNLTLLVSGTLARPLFDRFRIAREKLAYLIDSTSAPICILIPFNAWGAFNIGLIANTGDADPLRTFVYAIPLNLYPICAVILAGLSIKLPDIGPMRLAQQRTQAGQLLWPGASPMLDPAILAGEENDRLQPRASLMLLPILAMLIALPIGMLITGKGEFSSGSGSTSVLWAVILALVIAWVLSLIMGIHKTDQLMKIFMRGAGSMFPVATILVLSIALGNIANQMQTGAYLAALLQDSLSPTLLLPLIFILCAAIAFSIGSSWGTFALMIPVALPIAISLGLPPAPFLAAVLSGAIFGDHASPISDTTIVASMAAATDHIDHVRTQLPYALIAGFISLSGFALMGAMY